MAHTRGGGIGNMAGSDDRTLTELVAELRERVVMGGGEAHVYRDELERLIASTVYYCWQPIETAPVEPLNVNDHTYRFYCLLQWNNFEGQPVTGEGYAKYIRPGFKNAGALSWRSYGSPINPKYWMPLPAPKVEP